MYPINIAIIFRVCICLTFFKLAGWSPRLVCIGSMAPTKSSIAAGTSTKTKTSMKAAAAAASPAEPIAKVAGETEKPNNKKDVFADFVATIVAATDAESEASSGDNGEAARWCVHGQT